MISNSMNIARSDGIHPKGSSSHERIRKAKTAKVLMAIEEDQRKRNSNLIASIDGALTGKLERYRENSINMGVEEVYRLRRLNTHQALHNIIVPPSSTVTSQYHCVESKINIYPDEDYDESKITKVQTNDFSCSFLDGLQVCAPNRDDYLEDMFVPNKEKASHKFQAKRRNAIVSYSRIPLYKGQS